MAQTRNTENDMVKDRRLEGINRRVGSERRNEQRLRHMRGECRHNVPRRHTDMAGRLVEGELWWSGH